MPIKKGSESEHVTDPMALAAWQEAERAYGRQPVTTPAPPAQPAITAGDWQLVRALVRDGLSPREVAERTGLAPPDVGRIAATLKDTRDAAREILHAHAHTLAERVVSQADVEQSLEVLDRLDVAPKRRDDDRGNAVQVIVGIQLPPERG